MAIATHERHGWHPLSMIAFTALMIGGVFSALWVITLVDLPDNKPTNMTYGIIALALLLTAAALFTHQTRSLHHSPLMPDNTDAEIDRYLTKVHR
jgi:drug/metabolite transporter (DMT)-like permease